MLVWITWISFRGIVRKSLYASSLFTWRAGSEQVSRVKGPEHAASCGSLVASGSPRSPSHVPGCKCTFNWEFDCIFNSFNTSIIWKENWNNELRTSNMSERDRRLALPIGQIRTGDTFNKLGVGNNTGKSWSEMEDCIFSEKEMEYGTFNRWPSSWNHSSYIVIVLNAQWIDCIANIICSCWIVLHKYSAYPYCLLIILR